MNKELWNLAFYLAQIWLKPYVLVVIPDAWKKYAAVSMPYKKFVDCVYCVA